MTKVKIHFNNMEYIDLSKDVIVTGGKGLVGSEIVYANQIDRDDVDLTDRKQTIEYFCDLKPKWVIHCAGLVGGVKANMSRKADFFNQNLLMGLNVLEGCQKADVDNLITFMSTCIFPEKHAISNQLNEELIHDGIPHSSNYGYAYAKRMLDVGITVYKDQYNVKNWFSLIPTNLYGPNDNYNIETSHLIPGLIRKAHLAKLNNKELSVWGSGNPIREFVYVKDIARLLYNIVTSDYQSTYDKIIVAPKEKYTIREIAKIIADKFEINDLSYDCSYPDGQYQKVTNASRFNELFPDFKFTSLDEGLNETIEFYLNNQEKIRV